MASLWQIDREIMDCIDMDTGEVVDIERLSKLQMVRERKLEGVALCIKNLRADALAYKAEKEAFAERERQAKDKEERLSEWLTKALNGETMQTNRVAVNFRKSEAVLVDEEKCPEEYMNKKVTYSPDKTRIKAAIKAGKNVEGCELVLRNNIQIK